MVKSSKHNLTSKERSLLKDLQTQEQLCVDKYTEYAQKAQDPELRQIFNECLQAEQNHYNTISQILNGNVPSMASGNAGQASGNQGVSGSTATGSTMNSIYGQRSGVNAGNTGNNTTTGLNNTYTATTSGPAYGHYGVTGGGPTTDYGATTNMTSGTFDNGKTTNTTTGMPSYGTTSNTTIGTTTNTTGNVTNNRGTTGRKNNKNNKMNTTTSTTAYGATISATGGTTGTTSNVNASNKFSHCDENLCTDMLSTEKFVSGTYNTVIFETIDPSIRNALNHIQKEEQQHGEKIFNFMQKKGWYQPQQ